MQVCYKGFGDGNVAPKNGVYQSKSVYMRAIELTIDSRGLSGDVESL